MKHGWKYWLMGLAATLSLSAQAETLHYLVLESNAVPFQIVESGQSRGGIVTEILEEVFAGSEHQVQFHLLPLRRIHQLVRAHTYHNWIAYDAKVWNALKVSSYVDVPLFTVKHACLCNPAIRDLADLEHKTLGVLKDFDYPGLESAFAAGTYEEFRIGDYESAVRMVEASRIEGYIEMELRLRYHLQQLGRDSKRFSILDFSSVIPPYDIYFAVDPDMSIEMRLFIDRKLTEMKKQGDIERILARYR